VKITKWSGREGVNVVVVSPQVVNLKDGHEIEIEIENPYYDRSLELRKHEKVACLSILTCPVPRYLSDSAPDRYSTPTQRWFRVSQAVLHRKGKLFSIRIPPGRSMKIIATLKGAIKKYVGMEVLITEIMGSRCPIEPQICRILENDCVGFMVTNRGSSELVVEKEGQEVALVSVMVRTDLEHHNHQSRR